MRSPLRYAQKQKRTNKYSNHFDALPDDLVVSILSNLSTTASSPSDFVNILLACKRLNRLGVHSVVLSKLGAKALVIKPQNWSESAHRFLKHCANAGNLHALYTLGMIRFYCLQSRRSGLALMAKAAIKSHAPSLYSLAVIHFNGSGGTKDLRAGVALCARASLLGHIDALRELGHCFQDGYGTKQSIAQGRRLLILANARELAFVLRAVAESSPAASSSLLTWQARGYRNYAEVEEVLAVNWFLREWFESGRGGLGKGMRLCTHVGCGRAETRPHEFRRCSVCGEANYCSRACQALDWKLRHKMECETFDLWVEENFGDGGGGGGGDDAAVGGGRGDGVVDTADDVTA